DPDTALAALQARHAALKARLQAWGDCRDGLEIWARQGIAAPERLPLLDTDEFLIATADRSLP
ncbi:biotin-independent malonate decarboxylase subunit beta, partial [Stenotrophomonas maltophilia]